MAGKKIALSSIPMGKRAQAGGMFFPMKEGDQVTHIQVRKRSIILVRPLETPGSETVCEQQKNSPIYCENICSSESATEAEQLQNGLGKPSNNTREVENGCKALS